MNIVMLDNQIRDHIIIGVANLFDQQIDSAYGTADHVAAGEAYYDLIYGDYVDILNQSPPPLVQPATKLPFNFNTKDFLLPLSKPRRVFAHSTPQQLHPELFLRGDNPAIKNNPTTRAFTDAFNRWYQPIGHAIRRSEKWTREIRTMLNGIDTVNILLDTCPPFIDLLPPDVKRALLREDGDVTFIMGGELVKATAEVVTLLVTEKVTGRLPPLPHVAGAIPEGPAIPVTGTYDIPQAAFAKSIVSTAHVTTVSNPPDLSSAAMQTLANDIMNKVRHAST